MRINKARSKRNPESIINILTIVLGVLIAYSMFVSFTFLYTSNALKDARGQINGLSIQNEVLREKLNKEHSPS